MIQEIIVYIILIITALHILQQALVFFKPIKNHGNGSSCSGGSCSNCSLKFDLNSIQPELNNPKQTKRKFIHIKNLH